MSSRGAVSVSEDGLVDRLAGHDRRQQRPGGVARAESVGEVAVLYRRDAVAEQERDLVNALAGERCATRPYAGNEAMDGTPCSSVRLVVGMGQDLALVSRVALSVEDRLECPS